MQGGEGCDSFPAWIPSSQYQSQTTEIEQGLYGMSGRTIMGVGSGSEPSVGRDMEPSGLRDHSMWPTVLRTSGLMENRTAISITSAATTPVSTQSTSHLLHRDSLITGDHLRTTAREGMSSPKRTQRSTLAGNASAVSVCGMQRGVTSKPIARRSMRGGAPSACILFMRRRSVLSADHPSRLCVQRRHTARSAVSHARTIASSTRIGSADG